MCVFVLHCVWNIYQTLNTDVTRKYGRREINSGIPTGKWWNIKAQNLWKWSRNCGSSIPVTLRAASQIDTGYIANTPSWEQELLSILLILYFWLYVKIWCGLLKYGALWVKLMIKPETWVVSSLSKVPKVFCTFPVETGNVWLPTKVNRSSVT